MEERQVYYMALAELKKDVIKAAGGLCLCMGLVFVCPQSSQAAIRQAEVQTRLSYIVKIEAPKVDVYADASDQSARQGQVARGQSFEVLGSAGQGWVRIKTDGQGGYIKTSGNASLVEKARETVDVNVKKRREVVEYALQFVGGRYAYGGVDPNKGVDCSGFTRYVLSNSASVRLPHSSGGQSSYGTPVSREEMQPGDLIFYGSAKRINHVAMYIGDGKVVHASTEKTGIKTSPYDYREPVKIVSLLS